MMRMSPNRLTVAHAEEYFSEKVQRLETYYSQGAPIEGQWMGQGAARLGLSGDVAQEQFSAVLRGVDPRTGAVLIPAADHNGIHLAGYEAVLDCPKSVSVQALVGGDSRLIDAHRLAVQRAMAEVEHFALTRQKAGSERVLTDNVVAASWTHLTTRPTSNGMPDPYLHNHIVLLNMTQRRDGEWRALEPLEIWRSLAHGSAIYQNELAREVEKLGYRIQVTAPCKWELEGYTPAQLDAFSQRRKDMLQYLADHGMPENDRTLQAASQYTKQAKRDDNPAQLRSAWMAMATQHGLRPGDYMRQALKNGDLTTQYGDRAIAQEAVAYAVAHSTERQAVADNRAIEAAALHYAVGRTDLDHIRPQINAWEAQQQLIVAAKPGDWQHAMGSFTTPEMLALEQQNLDMVRGGVGKAIPIGERHEVAVWGLGRGLLADQAGAALMTLSSRDWITAIEGTAGTGKTRTVSAIREFAEAHGYTVRGFGMTSGSVDVLREAGINAQTVASLLSSQLPQPAAHELWVIDESSLVDTRKANALLKTAREMGVDRIVFVGDQAQHHAISAGNPIRQFLEANMAVAQLTTIRRQKDPELRRAVEVAKTNGPGALDLLIEQQRVHEVENIATRYDRIALDYLRSHEAGQPTLVVSPGNDERRSLNQYIRDLLLRQGQVHKDGIDHAILTPRDLTETQTKFAGSFEPGDVVHFSKYASHISQGSYLTVKSTDWQTNIVTLYGKDGAEITSSPATWRAIEVYRWEQRHLAVGDRIQFTRRNQQYAIHNRALATIVQMGSDEVTVKFDTGRDVSIPTPQFRHIDYGYASTSHSAQGSTIPRVLVHLDSTRRAELVNRQALYVGMSRARADCQLYTDDIAALRRSVARENQKEIALDAIQQPQRVVLNKHHSLRI